MFDFNKSSRFHRGDQHFFINNEEVSGVTDISASSQSNMQQLKHIGMGNTTSDYYPSGPNVGSLSVSTQLISKDFFIDLTGHSGCNGYVLRNRKNSPLDFITDENFSFTSGYLTSYTLRGGVGVIPTVDAQFSVVGKLGRILTGESPKVTSDLENIQNYYPKYPSNIVSHGSTEIIGLEESGVGSVFQSNRILTYEVAISSKRNPIYALGRQAPVEVLPDYPLSVTFRFSLESNDVVPYTNSDYPCAPKSGDISIKLKNKDNGEIAHEYNFTKLMLISQSFSASTEGNQKLDLTYQTYVNRP